MKANPGSLAVFRTADITQFFLGRLLEPFDAYSVEVRDHREHSNMELLQTEFRSRVNTTPRDWGYWYKLKYCSGFNGGILVKPRFSFTCATLLIPTSATEIPGVERTN